MNQTSFDNVLAIDTATRNLNLALQFGRDRLVKLSEPVQKTHGQIIMKKIGDLFHSAGGTVDELQAIIVSLGPGSFTGLRIGLAAAKGMAVAGNLPVVGISLFEVAALRLRAATQAWVLIPSRRGEYYVGTTRSGVLDRDSVRLVSESDLESLIGPGPAYGVEFDPTETLASLIPDLTGGHLACDAGDLIRIGLDRLRDVGPTNLAELEPIYLQKAIAEVRFDQRQRGTE